MNKKLSMRMLAGFLAFIMVFFSVSDYSVFAADTATDVVAEVDADDADSAADVESNDSVDVTVDDGDTATVTETVSANNTDDANSVVVDEEEVKPVKDLAVSISFSGNTWTVIDDKGNSYAFATLSDGVLTFNKIEKDIALEVPGNMFLITGADAVASQVTSVKFENDCKIALIAQSSFRACKNLKTVDFSNLKSLKTIDTAAFKGCSALSKVTFSESLTTINESAFEGCNLSEVTLTKNIVKLDKYVFKGNANLKKVIYSAAVLIDRDFDNYSDDIFAGCSLNEIVFTDTTLATWPSYVFSGATFEKDYELVIPSQFRTIGRAAFCNVQNVKKVSFQKKSDGKYNVTTFEQGAFFQMLSLEEFEIPDTLTAIKWQCFELCTNLTDMDLAAKAPHLDLIGKWAFRSCGKLENVTIPSGVTAKYDVTGLYMDPYDSAIEAFDGCLSLKSIVIDFPEVCIGEFQNTGLETVTFGTRVKSIQERAFTNCTGITKLDTGSARYIGVAAFKECTNITSLKLSDNVTTIDNEAFYNCSKLASIATDSSSDTNPFPKSLVAIGDHAFFNCDSILNTVTFYDKLERIGQYAFSCDATKSINQVTYARNMRLATLIIPENVKYIGEGAFERNTGLYSVIIKSKVLGTDSYVCGQRIFAKALISNLVLPAGIEEIPAYLFCGAGFEPKFKMTIPTTVKKIGAYAFAGGTNDAEAILNPMIITEFIFPTGTQLEEIDGYAFAHNATMTNFDIPSTVTKLGSGAFAHCTNIGKIVIPENVEELGSEVFLSCASAETIEYNAIDVKVCGEGIFRKCNIRSIVIGPKVKTIPEGLFMDATFFSSGGDDNFIPVDITIPAEITEIKRNAFNNVKNLRSIIFESDKNLTQISEAAFSGCENLQKIMIPDTVTVIGASAFKDCKSLVDVNMPKDLESLGDSAFKGCISLPEIIIPEKLEIIGIRSFEGCKGAKKITYRGNRVKEIQENAFAECSGLVGLLDVNHGVEKIGSLAFADCTGVTALQLPTSIMNVEDIADNAFEGCTGITKYYAVKDSAAYQWLVKMNLITGSNFEAMNAIKYVGIEEGDFNPNPGGYHTGEEITFKPVEREGYTFLGFYEDEALTKEIKSTVGKSGDLTLYIKWDAKMFKVTYDMNGTGVNHVDNPATIAYGKDLKLYAPVYRGFGFAKWVLVVEGEDGNEYEEDIEAVLNEAGLVDYYVVKNVKKDIKVRAIWEEVNYLIRFNLNNEKASFRNDSTGYPFPGEMNVNGGAQISLYNENQVKCAGSALMGWNTQADGKGTHYEPGEYVTGLATARDQVIDLYAEWESGCYYIKYSIGKGATVSDNVLYTKVPASSTKQKKLLEAQYVNKPGYTLVGWSTKKNGKGDVYRPGEMMSPLKPAGKTATLYAMYTINTYGIRYVLPEGAVNSPKNKTEYTVAKTMSLKKPSLPGYVFVGWYKEYTPENGYKQKVTKLSKGKQTGNLTLYARFQTSITYNANGGKLTGAGKTLLKNSAKTEYDPSGMITLAAPAVTEMYKSGLNFAGWSTTKDGVTGAFYEVGKAYPYKDIVNACGGKKIKLYAQWR